MVLICLKRKNFLVLMIKMTCCLHCSHAPLVAMQYNVEFVRHLGWDGTFLMRTQPGQYSLYLVTRSGLNNANLFRKLSSLPSWPSHLIQTVSSRPRYLFKTVPCRSRYLINISLDYHMKYSIVKDWEII